MNKSLLALLIFVFTVIQTGCANTKMAARTSTSLANFIGVSELPDWYVNSRYRYSDSQKVFNDFGLEIHYRDLGEGPTVVLIHGEMSSLHEWESWIEKLSADFRVIAIDLPGSGLTGTTRCVRDMEELCPENLTEEYLLHTLTYFIEDLKLRNINIIGSSLGAYLGLKYAAAQPNNVDKLILLSPSGLQQTPPSSLGYVANTSFIGRWFQPAPVMTRIVTDFFARDENATRSEVSRRLHLLQGDGGFDSNAYQLRMIEDLMLNGSTFDFSSVKTDALILWGAYDRWSSPELAPRWDAQLPNSTLLTYPNLGHALMVELPEETVADAIAFIQDEPLPTLEGLGTGNKFLMKDAGKGMDANEIFGTDGFGGSDEVEMVDEP